VCDRSKEEEREKEEEIEGFYLKKIYRNVFKKSDNILCVCVIGIIYL